MGGENCREPELVPEMRETQSLAPFWDFSPQLGNLLPLWQGKDTSQVAKPDPAGSWKEAQGRSIPVSRRTDRASPLDTAVLGCWKEQGGGAGEGETLTSAGPSACSRCAGGTPCSPRGQRWWGPGHSAHPTAPRGAAHCGNQCRWSWPRGLGPDAGASSGSAPPAKRVREGNRPPHPKYQSKQTRPNTSSSVGGGRGFRFPGLSAWVLPSARGASSWPAKQPPPARAKL